MSQDYSNQPADNRPANEQDASALVLRPPGAVEKTEPGAKRILSGMVADTLALAKTRPTERVVSVLVGGSWDYFRDAEIVSLYLSRVDKGLTAKVQYCERTHELLAALESRKFDLAFLYLHLFSPPPLEEQQQLENLGEILRKAEWFRAEDTWVTGCGLGMVGFMNRVHGIPVVVVTGSGYPGAEGFVKQAGATALFHLPFELEPFCEILRGILQPGDLPSQRRQRRIIMVDDDRDLLDFYQLVIQKSFKNVEVLTFTGGKAALEELSRTTPDLFITDLNMPKMDGLQVLSILAGMKVKFPVMMLTSIWDEGFVEHAHKIAEPHFDFTYFHSPGNGDEVRKFIQEVSKLIGVEPDIALSASQ